MKSLLKIGFFAVCYLTVLGCQNQQDTPSLKAFLLDRKAKSALQKKQYEEAQNLYFNMLEVDPNLAEAHSNIGNILLFNKKEEDSLKSLQEALKIAQFHQEKKVEFLVRYNLGVYFGLQKKIPEALEQYQAALEIIPDSIETKHNIELLIQNGSSSKDSKDGDKKDSSSGSGDSKDKKDGKDGKDDKDDKDDKNKKDQDKKDQDKKDGKDDKDDDKEQESKKEKQVKPNAKYKPRPYQGDQLSEGDVKKILGELKNQEQKIRANFDKKERKENKNEKDW